MSTTTEVLNLFKYDTEADKKEKFNINQSLNNNWDKIDKFAKEVGKGSGLEIGDIGFAPYVDETTNERRRLNGQVLIKDQYPAFVTWLTSLQATTPSLFTTEDNWQAIKTASKLGQCGKFVIGDTTIRLPQVININGLVDMSNAGLIKNESLPAHMHSRGTQEISGVILAGHGASGAFAFTREQNCRVDYNGANVNDMYEYSFKASRTWTGKTSNPDNSTYQDNAPVQQEAIQYPYYIVVNTGSESSEPTINDYTVTTVYQYGMSQYYKGIMNSGAWLRSNGQMNPKAIYEGLYNWALAQLNAGVEGFKNYTDDDITDYDFVINQSDESFILPLKNGQEGVFIDSDTRVTVKSGTAWLEQDNGGINGVVQPYNNGSPPSGWATLISNGIGVGINAVPVLFNNVTVPSGYNLYYYCGNVEENPQLVNVARIEEALVDKVDVANTQWAVNACMPDYSAGVSLLEPSEYRILPCDCFVTCSADNESNIAHSGFWFASPDEKKQYYYAIAHQYKISNFGLNIPKGWKVKSYSNRSTIIYYPLKGAK